MSKKTLLGAALALSLIVPMTIAAAPAHADVGVRMGGGPHGPGYHGGHGYPGTAWRAPHGYDHRRYAWSGPHCRLASYPVTIKVWNGYRAHFETVIRTRTVCY